MNEVLNVLEVVVVDAKGLKIDEVDANLELVGTRYIVKQIGIVTRLSTRKNAFQKYQTNAEIT